MTSLNLWKVHPSSLNLGYTCSGAPWLLGQLSPQEPGNASLRWGTLAHAWLEIAIEFSAAVASEWMATDPDLDDFNSEMHDTWVWVSEQYGPLELATGETEKRLRLDLPEVGAYISGRLDWTRRAKLADWKWGPGAQWYLPPIEVDLQMLAYAQLVHASWPEEPEVVVQRVLLTPRLLEELRLSQDDLARDRELLLAVVGDIVEGRDHRTPGTHCDHCLARSLCPERLELAEQALALVPREPQLTELTSEQATRYALSRKAIRERLVELDKALEEYVESGGVVEADGKRLAVSRYQADRIVNSMRVIGDLAIMAGGGAGALATRTSKDAIEEALKAVGKKKELPKLLKRWREQGWVAKEPRSSLRWRKKPARRQRLP